ncbi:hypothetical protein INT45_005290 [Circinella minor]|uniref:Phosphatase activator n=1 Tax=Circinella minor TaxID=1195481 RepID=A0A8H7VJ51_9FUNG|nr:hypothetical protein INT45_005290 [Circinella minor]
MSSESPILQVPEPTDNSGNSGQDDLIYQQHEVEDDGYDNPEDAIPQRLKLDLRGSRVDLDRDTLVNLPESLLIAMFPNGLILGGNTEEEESDGRRQRRHDDDLDEDDEYEDHSRDSVGGIEEQVNYVDFDPHCLDYVLRFYQYAREQHEKSNTDNNTEEGGDQDSSERYHQQLAAATATSSVFYPLLTKQPIIVLREELEYFCVPTNGSTTESTITSPEKNKKNGGIDMVQLKVACGHHLKQHDQIFDALQKNISRENNIAEQHLIDMLCDAGFMRDDRWGYRELEPMRTCVVSMALVLLKTTGPDNHMATAQKLLLFWRKPARKCWWDGTTNEIQGQKVRLWARRTWTLELALV